MSFTKDFISEYENWIIPKEMPYLSFEHNKVAHNAKKMSIHWCKTFMEQYSCFSRHALHMLLLTELNTYKAPRFQYEIKLNIEEEMGLHTNQVPHLILMREGYKEDLDVDVTKCYPFNETKGLLDGLTKIFNTQDYLYIMGAATAFEYVAIDEFKSVSEIAYKINPKMKHDSKTSIYLEGHKHFEVGHADALVHASDLYLEKIEEEEKLHKYKEGFEAVCKTLNTWWGEIHWNMENKKSFHEVVNNL